MKLTKLISATFVAIALSGAASAASFVYTEGMRGQIAGSTLIGPDVDATNSAPGFFLGAINGGDSIDVHGRVVSRKDFYEFTSTRAFSIRFIFGGYTYEPGTTIDPGDDNTISGLVSRPFDVNDNSPANFFLNGAASAGNTFTANVTSGNDLIFGRTAAGTYTLEVNGGLAGPDVLYDIRIQAVPLPAGALLLLTGLAGLGIARRRRT